MGGGRLLRCCLAFGRIERRQSAQKRPRPNEPTDLDCAAENFLLNDCYNGVSETGESILSPSKPKASVLPTKGKLGKSIDSECKQWALGSPTHVGLIGSLPDLVSSVLESLCWDQLCWDQRGYYICRRTSYYQYFCRRTSGTSYYPDFPIETSFCHTSARTRCVETSFYDTSARTRCVETSFYDTSARTRCVKTSFYNTSARTRCIETSLQHKLRQSARRGGSAPTAPSGFQSYMSYTKSWYSSTYTPTCGTGTKLSAFEGSDQLTGANLPNLQERTYRKHTVLRANLEVRQVRGRSWGKFGGEVGASWGKFGGELGGSASSGELGGELGGVH